MSTATSGMAQLLVILASTCPEDWESFGVLAGKLRQAQRRKRKRFEIMQARLASDGYAARRERWRMKGHFVCRHGVFFARPQIKCPCMDADSRHDDSAWQHARRMASIDHELKDIVTTEFHRETFKRLGQLQAELRRRNYY